MRPAILKTQRAVSGTLHLVEIFLRRQDRRLLLIPLGDVKMDDIPLAYRRDTAPRHLARLIHFITDSDFLTAKPLSSFRIVFTRSEQRKRC